MKNFIFEIIQLFKRKPNAALFLIVLIVCPIIGTGIATLILQNANTLLINHLSIFSIVLIYIAISFFMALGLVPTTVIAFASGFLWGWQILPLMIIAYGCALFFGYKFTQWSGGNELLDEIMKMRFYHAKVNSIKKIENEWSLVFFCRLSPILSFGIMNYLLTMLKVNILPFMIAGTIGMLPRTCFFIWIGLQANSLISMPATDWKMKLFWFLLSAFSILMIIKILQNIYKKSISISDN